jgi:hypothetical protein
LASVLVFKETSTCLPLKPPMGSFGKSDAAFHSTRTTTLLIPRISHISIYPTRHYTHVFFGRGDNIIMSQFEDFGPNFLTEIWQAAEKGSLKPV